MTRRRPDPEVVLTERGTIDPACEREAMRLWARFLFEHLMAEGRRGQDQPEAPPPAPGRGPRM